MVDAGVVVLVVDAVMYKTCLFEDINNKCRVTFVLKLCVIIEIKQILLPFGFVFVNLITISISYYFIRIQ